MWIENGPRRPLGFLLRRRSATACSYLAKRRNVRRRAAIERESGGTGSLEATVSAAPGSPAFQLLHNPDHGPLIDPGPCRGCVHARRCATGEACKAFSLFVRSGDQQWQRVLRQPSRLYFEQIFHEDGEARKAV